MIKNKRLWGILGGVALAAVIGTNSYLKCYIPKPARTPQTTTIDEVLENYSDNSFENAPEGDGKEEIVSPQNKLEEYFRRKEPAQVREINKQPNHQQRETYSQEEDYDDDIPEEEELKSVSKVMLKLYEFIGQHKYKKAKVMIDILKKNAEKDGFLSDEATEIVEKDAVEKILVDYDGYLDNVIDERCKEKEAPPISVWSKVAYMNKFLIDYRINEKTEMYWGFINKGNDALFTCGYYVDF